MHEAAAKLRHSGSYIVGVGVNRPAPTTKCWMYFPESDAPFYRVTYLSNYSPEVVPDATRQHSLLAEISHSEFKPECSETVVERTVRGMVSTELLREEDARDIVDVHVIERDYTYPLPGLERDGALARDPSVARVAQHLLARPVRRVALRGRQHGPLGRAGRGVGEPHRARRARRRAHVSGQARLLNPAVRCASSRPRSRRTGSPR